MEILSSTTERNLADSLADLLPDAKIVHTTDVGISDADQLIHLAVPKGFKIETIDNENLLRYPRRIVSTAEFSTGESFIDYVKRHASPASMGWCDFNPQTFKLAFTAVLDDHQNSLAGWRKHQAVFKPEMSAEWKTWTERNGIKYAMSQLDFAEFLERNADDINGGDDFPTSLDMMTMATSFEANSEKRIKSVVRLQGGGTRLDYVDDDDAATITSMKAFEKFRIGIPVFWAGLAYRITARLKYRHAQGKVAFYYELIRPDLVHATAAKELIGRVQEGISTVPLLMGACR
jgi:uncharacterized protein YfdQ (DUF2303 family)